MDETYKWETPGGIKGIKRGLVSGWVVVGIIDESLVEQGGGTAPI